MVSTKRIMIAGKDVCLVLLERLQVWAPCTPGRPDLKHLAGAAFATLVVAFSSAEGRGGRLASCPG